MRVFENCYTLMSEAIRDLLEMGVQVKTNSMQNKIVIGKEEYETKEIINYSYCLLSLDQEDVLFKFTNCKDWAKAEFEERITYSTGINPGKAWELRRDIWEQFLVTERGNNNIVYPHFDYSYNNRIHKNDGLLNIISELKKNPYSRQCVLSIWDPSDTQYLGGKKRIPCSIYYQFLFRDGKLNIIYNQRSCDIFNHFGNDVYLAWKMMEHVANAIDVPVGILFHNITSFHVYNKDFPKLIANI